MGLPRLSVGTLLLLQALAAPRSGRAVVQLIFTNGFESGTLCSWSAGQPPLGGPPYHPPSPSLFLLHGTSGYPVPASTMNPVARFALQVPAGGSTAITLYCLARFSSTPALDHPCWRPVPGVPATTLDIADEPIRLGFVPAIVVLHAFVRDPYGNVSTLRLPESSGEGKDHARIDYDPGAPPIVDNFFVTTTAYACPEFSATDLDTTISPDLFLRWKVDFPSGPPPAPSIHVEYTTDDVHFTEIPASPLANSAGVGCQIATCGMPFTGCYVLRDHGLPSTYVRFRIRAVDSKGAVTVRSSIPPLNVAQSLRFVVGNPDPGIDGSATAAVFNNGATQPSFFPDRHSLVVGRWGDVFFRDKDNGLLWVDPDTGIVSRLARTTGVATDGPLSGPTPATFIAPGAIFMTHEGNVLVWDGPTIRRVLLDVNGKPSQLETVIGTLPGCGGSGCICNSCSIVPLPGGSFYFANSIGLPGPGPFDWKIYRWTGGSIEAIVPSGTGYSADASASLGTCLLYDVVASYDPASGSVRRLHAGVVPYGGCAQYGYVSMDPAGVSVTTTDAAAPHLPSIPAGYGFSFTGLDGLVYQYSDLVQPGLFRYDDRADTLLSLVGVSSPSTPPPCPSGSPAASCHPHAHDAFVDGFGGLFWSSLGRIRALDFDTGTVADVFGQGLDYGEGGDALNVRLAYASTLGVWNDGVEHVTYVDNVNSRIREATVGGSVIRRAGNGLIGYPIVGGASAASEPLYTPAQASFLLDGAGRIYWSGASELLFSDGPASPWQRLAGHGATPYWQAPEDTPGDQIDLGYWDMMPFGSTPNRVLFALTRFDGIQWADGMVKSYAKTDGAQRHIAGVTGPVSSTCADGVLRTSCSLFVHPYAWARTRAFYDAPRARWIWQSSVYPYGFGEFDVFDDDGDGGPPGALKSSLGDPLGFDLRSWTYRYEGAPATDVLYLCKSDGRLRKAVRDGATWLFEDLPWPIAGLTCSGQDIVWSSDGKRLLFPYRYLGLGGIAAYVIDPD
jgi:hypothetical protein